MAKFIIGFMGSGKTTVAKLLDSDYVDMDALITAQIGMPIAQFFEEKGEAAFRELEANLLTELAASDGVVATGGGIVENDRNRKILSENAETIYLKADFETLYKRIQADKETIRPLFINNSKAAFKAIYDRRQGLYQAVASQMIDVTHKKPIEIIEELR